MITKKVTNIEIYATILWFTRSIPIYPRTHLRKYTLQIYSPANRQGFK